MVGVASRGTQGNLEGGEVRPVDCGGGYTAAYAFQNPLNYALKGYILLYAKLTSINLTLRKRRFVCFL